MASGLKFFWENGEVYCRCTVRPKVRIKTKEWDGSLVPLLVDSVGFVRVRMDGYEGHLYGTVSPTHPKSFGTIEEAKAYVEEQSLIGLTLNKLGV
jgi:hypothetical protein